jgi:hypothetical protein
VATDIGDTSQLLTFIRAVNDKFEAVTELRSVEATRGAASGEFFCERLSAALERHKLSCNKLISVNTEFSG